MSDLEAILRKSLEERRAKPLQAATDLNSIAAEMSAAIHSVTNGRIKFLLDPLKPKEGRGPTFALVLRLADEDRVLRVTELSELGYPVILWPSYMAWDTQKSVLQFSVPDKPTLRTNILHMIDNPQSEVVRIIANELAVMQDESGTLAGSAVS